LTSEGYRVIIDQHLAPFMANFNGGDCRLLQDNAPTHVTDLTYEALYANRIHWVTFFSFLTNIKVLSKIDVNFFN
jgi:hypothetical protein